MPDEFFDVLNDEELDSDDGVVEDVEENIYEGLAAELDNLNVCHKYYIFIYIIFV